jgi:hypothetical protein
LTNLQTILLNNSSEQSEEHQQIYLHISQYFLANYWFVLL